MAELRLLLRLAARNALRNPRRSVFTLVSIFLGVGLLIVARSFVDGIDATLVAVEIDHDAAHVRVMPPGWLAEEDWQPLDKPFPEAAVLAAELPVAFPGARVVPRVSFAAEIGDGRRTLRCRGLSVDLVAYAGLFALGDLTPPPGDEPVAFVGVDLARAFGWKTGDHLFLKAKTRRGTLNALDGVRLAGLIASGHPLVDNFTILVPATVGGPLLDLEPGFATELMVRLPDAEQAEVVAAWIGGRFPRLTAETWFDRTRDFRSLNAIRRAAFDIVIGLILLIAAAGVANTALMSAFERTAEIGTLLALGLTRGRVVALLLTESTLIASVGALLGAAVGTAVSAWYTRVGLDFGELTRGEDVVAVPPHLYWDLRPGTVGLAVGIGLAVALVSAAWPAIRASRLLPIEALREGG